MVKKPTSRSAKTPVKPSGSCLGCQAHNYQPHFSESCCAYCHQPLHNFYCSGCIPDKETSPICIACEPIIQKMEKALENPELPWAKSYIEFANKTFIRLREMYANMPISQRPFRLPIRQRLFGTTA